MGAAQQTARLLSAANSVNATLVAAVPSLLYSISGWNAGAVTYLKLYDKATAPDQNDTPRQTIHLPASGRFQIDFPSPLAFTKGIGYRLTTGSADNDTGVVAAAAVLGLNIDYS